MLRNLVLSIFIGLSFIFSSIASADITVGVNAPRGVEKTGKQWAAYADYLSQKLGEKVVIKPLLPGELVKKAGEVDFMLANPTQSVVLLEEQKAKPLATLNKKYGSKFAGVIVAKKGSGITKAEDLKGKKVMSLKFRQAAGAYMFQTYHLIHKGVDPHKDFASFTEGKKQDDLVMAVQAGKIDAAFIRTGILENMQKEGKIKMSDFVVVDARDTSKFKLVHSTALYPEWYLLALPKASPTVAARVKEASLALKPGDQAAKKAKIQGMVKPVNIRGMQAVMIELRIRPYAR